MRHLLAGLTVLLAACGSDPGFVGEVPTNPDALPGWLSAGDYLAWDSESSIHPTAGPHGESVRTYFNLTLAASLEGDNSVHQVEAAAVKELYDKGLVVGWAMMVKTEASGEPDAWYWYEILDRESPGDVFEGQALAVCSGCHAAGRDFVLSPYPD
jgi:hypothetical protein